MYDAMCSWISIGMQMYVDKSLRNSCLNLTKQVKYKYEGRMQLIDASTIPYSIQSFCFD